MSSFGSGQGFGARRNVVGTGQERRHKRESPCFHFQVSPPVMDILDNSKAMFSKLEVRLVIHVSDALLTYPSLSSNLRNTSIEPTYDDSTQ